MAQTAPVANTSTPSAVSPPAGATAQLSYSGTPRGNDGTTTPDDYVREMADPVRRMEIFEEMRASDDAVHTAIDSRRQEINAANWVLSSEDKTPRGLEILEFVEDNTYPVLDDVLRWLGGGGIQYGWAAVEPVFTWADKPTSGMIKRGKLRRPTRSAMRGLYIAKVAHLRQPSVQTFKISETGDLQRVVQEAYNGASYRRVEIPPEKLLLWTYDRQGDDRWGVPPTRHCYKAWTFKQQIEKLNLLHIDRFGVGMPVVEEGEGWGQAERQTLAAFMRTWRSSGTSYLMHPNGGKITIAADDGKTTMSMLEWVKYYNLAIAKTYLTQQTELGSTETGARALGESFVEGMKGLVQADCEELAALLNDVLVKRLVDWNFGEQADYPTFEPSQRVSIGGGAASMLKQLVDAGVVHPRPEDEGFMRDAMGLPAVAIETLEAEQGEREAAAEAIKNAAAAAAGGGADGQQPPPAKADDDAVPSATPAKKPLAIAASMDRTHWIVQQLTLADGAPAPAVAYETTYRTPEYQAWEQGILRPDVLVRDLDLAASRLAGEVQDVLHDIDADLERQAAALGAKGSAALSAGVRDIAVPEKLRKRLRTVLLEAAQRSRDYGAKAVHNEIARQIAPEGIGPQRDSWMPPTYAPYESNFFARAAARIRALVAGDAEPTPQDLHLAAEVDRAVEDEIARRETSIRSAILTALAQAAGAAVDALIHIVATSARASLIGLSTGRTEANVQGVVNVGFGIGRTDAAASMQVVAKSVSPELAAVHAQISSAAASATAAASAAQQAATAAETAAAATQAAVSAAKASDAATAASELGAARSAAATAAQHATVAADAANEAAAVASDVVEAAKATGDTTLVSATEKAATAAKTAATTADETASTTADAADAVATAENTGTSGALDKAVTSTKSATKAAAKSASATAVTKSAVRSAGAASRATTGGSGLKDAEGNDVGLVAKVYSAVMDLGTCDECAKWDAGEFPIDYPEDYTGVQAPNPRCAGGYGRCRCIFVYITSRESVPLVPAGKGPGPIRGGVFV